MAQTTSTMVDLGTKAVDFTLINVITNNPVNLSSLKGTRGTVIFFICNHCPFVKHINTGLVELANNYIPKGFSFFGISSNDVKSYPEDAPDKMKEVALQERYNFPYLYDEDQKVASAYNAACTPDFFIFNNELTLVYRGQLDDARPSNNIPVTGKDIRAALDNILDGKEVSPVQKPSIGCNIKWRKN